MAGTDFMPSRASSEGSSGAHHHKAMVTVTATERTKTVLACLFEALGAKRATQEVAKVLCALSAGTAEEVTAVASVAGGGEKSAQPDDAAKVKATAPRALLPVLASLPERSVDVVGIALEILETGQSAADALARLRSSKLDRTAVFSVAADAAGR